MLQQILKDMYIEPDVLEALNEEQKKTLFLKMRQEQVRRWKEREEKLEREGGDNELKRAKPKKVNSKSVSWLLGRDGDVAVIVIGEVDELTSKFICSGFGENKSKSLQNNTSHESITKSKKMTEDVRTKRENLPPKTQPGISLNMKPDSKSGSATESVPQPSVCSRPPVTVNVRPASSNATVGCVNSKPGLTNPRLDTTVPSSSTSSTVKTDSGSASQSKGGLCTKEPQKLGESQEGKDVSASQVTQKVASEAAGTSGTAPISSGRGRVAQLMKTFSVDTSTQTPPRGVKPPLPTKPSHLRLTTTPTVR
ncbi:uncharacterized protein FYW49_014154 [Xenentodon cancila]